MQGRSLQISEPGKTKALKALTPNASPLLSLQNLVPIFIRLKNFAKDIRDESGFKLLNYIKKEFRIDRITDESETEALLTQGRTLILLDGLDEVSQADDEEVVDQIIKFCETYFKNHFIITCRIAAGKYKFQPEKFTEVEVADFNSEQIEAFAKKWFVAVAKNTV